MLAFWVRLLFPPVFRSALVLTCFPLPYFRKSLVLWVKHATGALFLAIFAHTSSRGCLRFFTPRVSTERMSAARPSVPALPLLFFPPPDSVSCLLVVLLSVFSSPENYPDHWPGTHTLLLLPLTVPFSPLSVASSRTFFTHRSATTLLNICVATLPPFIFYPCPRSYGLRSGNAD